MTHVLNFNTQAHLRITNALLRVPGIICYIFSSQKLGDNIWCQKKASFLACKILSYDHGNFLNAFECFKSHLRHSLMCINYTIIMATDFKFCTSLCVQLCKKVVQQWNGGVFLQLGPARYLFLYIVTYCRLCLC